MGTIAIIPARGGSKGIPRKNLARVGGRPLVVRSIEHARAAKAIDRVYVSTDDDEIAAASRVAGAEVIVRPTELSGDEASTESAVEHVLSRLDVAGIDADVIVLLQCTSPFRGSGQLDAALTKFEKSGCDSMFSGTAFRGFVWRETASVAGHEPATYDPCNRPRRQEIDGVYLETGSFYVFKREVFANTGSRLGGYIEVFEVPQAEAVDVDEPEDLRRARAVAGELDASWPAPHDQFQWLILDVDGTLTDGAMYYGEDGSEFKRFDTRDGAGIARFRAAGGKVAFITGEDSRAAERRAAKLDVDHIALGIKDKAAALRELMHYRKIEPAHIVAMGDDLNDLPMASMVGMFVAPAGARPEVIARADLVTVSGGGHGAVRELIDILLAHELQAVG